MNLFILEDEVLQREKLRRLVGEVLTSTGLMGVSVTAVGKGARLLDVLKQSGIGNLYLLDIEIKGDLYSGLELAKKIREQDYCGVIVFVTTHSEFASITYKYKVSAYDFIDKFSTEDELKARLCDCIHYGLSIQQESVGEIFVFENRNASFNIKFSDILYFETSGRSHQLRLVGKNETILFYGTLAEIQQKDPRFFISHRGILVNLTQVDKIDRQQGVLVFSDGQVCPISRRRIKPLIANAKELRKIIDANENSTEKIF